VFQPRVELKFVTLLGRQSIRNCSGVIAEVVSFFNMSAKRNLVLKTVLKTQLVALCKTRWTQRHDAVIKFLSKIPNVVASLEHISLWNDASSATKARMLLLSVKDPQFVVALHCLVDVLSLTLSISQFLQNRQICQICVRLR